MKNNQKLFGKYNELVLLLLGFVLTGVVGSYISQQLQLRAWNFQNLADIRERELIIANKTFEEVSILMDKRLYLSRQLIWSLEGNSKSVDSKLKDYVSVLYDWNFSLNRNLAVIEKYFGQEYRKKFYDSIHDKLRELNSQLSAYRSGKIDSLEKAKEIADDVNIEIYRFNLLMLEKIQNKNAEVI